MKHKCSILSNRYFPFVEPRNILNYLLENSGLSQEISADSGSYRTLLGQPVYLSVAVNQSGGETTLLTVSVRSEVPTAAAVHQAVKHRLQVCFASLKKFHRTMSL